ncbi:hypothetical protein [Prescottella agglutinans]|uniref:Uncharacterized protein n=1 Tax=Prescottella agglutinans TaxID=1644129 RepID=A0ABT6MG52_9NOCA|nr:hypothetical protein [Prescottella agglutinans]MDH6283286.1 hypothetical protein [Prescottella agglutinans]
MTDTTNTETVDSLPQWAQKMIHDLRNEAATNRKTATDAQAERDEVRTEMAAIHGKEALAGLTDILADPEDLARFVDTAALIGDDGKPDAAKYTDAARTLVTERPHLGRRVGRSGNEVAGGTTRPPASTDTAQQIADGTADFVAMVQGAQ